MHSPGDTGRTTMTSATITVDRKALHTVLQALVGPGHLIRELQHTRSLHKMGHPNPIDTLIEQYEAGGLLPEASPATQLTPTDVKWAEDLIRQLPADHDGRNSWLLNFGTAAPDLRPAADAQGQ